MKKNVSGQVVGCQLVSKTDGSAVTSGTTTVYVTGDGGTQAVGSVGSGACTHEGNGFWTYAPAQAETNYDHIAFTFVNTSACNVTLQIYPSFPQTGDSFVRVGAPVGASISADIAGVQADTDNIQTRLPAALVSGRMDASVGAMAANTMTASALATDAVDELVDAVWDEVLSGASHNVVNSAGRRLRQVDASFVITAGTAQAGSSSSITLAAGESATNDIYKHDGLIIVGGTGVGESAIITAYNGTTKVATVSPAFVITPDSTSEYEIVPAISSVHSIGDNAITAASVAADFVTEVQSGLATQSSVNTIDDFLDTEIAAIKAKTDNLPASPAAAGDAMTLEAAERTAVADALLGRNVAGGSSTGRTVKEALYVLRNKSAIAGGTLTVYATDDTTAAFTAAVTTAAGDPISGIDPS